MSNQTVVQQGQQVLIQNYARQPISMMRGQGAKLWDADGKQYIDLFAGFGGGILGHAHPDLVAAAAQQAGELWHVGNTFYTTPQIELAERLNRVTFPGRAFFCHSGAEANEAACKLARLRGHQDGRSRGKIISLHKSFHGRTMAMLAATGSTKYREGFGPDMPGFVQVPGGDFAALAAAVDDQTCGVLMEPIQGEGGMNEYPADYAQRVRELCDQRGLTLIFDEVWTGCGRTGKWFGHQYFSTATGGAVTPDIMTIGKAIGGGLPVGVMYARPEVAALLTPGKHGCTLGGNPICMAVAKTIFHVIERDSLLAHANELGAHTVARLKGELGDRVKAIRGRGLFLGIELPQKPERLVERALERGVVINVTADTVVRLAPPINITRQELDLGLDRAIAAIKE
jgi:acetylornithine aminotransferase